MEQPFFFTRTIPEIDVIIAVSLEEIS